MPIEMPRGLPFSVDTWTPNSSRKRHHFLTHAHKDHLSGISSLSSFPIYCSSLTKSLLILFHPQLESSLFVEIEVGQSIGIDDPDGNFTVTAFDANHCPGAVMFLFEGSFGNILHTGDCRLTAECLQCLPDKYLSKNEKEPRCRLDCVFLDCTFGSFHQSLPSKHSSIQQVINCIWKNPNACVVYLTCDLLGQENILTEVSRTFGSKIYVDKAINPECLKTLQLTAPQILTKDPRSRFHLFSGFPNLPERAAAKFAEAKANSKPQPQIIRPSTQWYACEEADIDTHSRKKKRYNEAMRDDFGIWHVCYSMHSSREELEWALKVLSPKCVVSTTPSCGAIELDYVRKQSRLSKDNPIWKLLGIDFDNSKEDLSVPAVNFPLVDKRPSDIPQHVDVLSLSPPSKRPAVTLFGRARLCISGSEAKFAFTESYSETTEKIDHEAENKDAILVGTEHQLEKETEKVERCSSSTEYDESLRKLYRSMNVPVPRPLPSLRELYTYNKQNKRRIRFLS